MIETEYTATESMDVKSPYHLHQEQHDSRSPQQEQQVDSSPEEQLEEKANIAPQSPVEDDRTENLRRLREKNQRVERERDDLARRIQEIESRSKSTDVEESDLQIEPDALAEGKHLKQVMQKIKRLEEDNKRYRQQSAVDITEARLKSQYSDFDKVVSRDNIESLREMYPEIADSIHGNPDIYKRAVAAYTTIKKMGIYQDSEKYAEDRALVQKNAAKPKPMASISPQQGDSPLSKANAFANGLTDALKQQLQREMANSRKGH